jgi:hypothetical protein
MYRASLVHGLANGGERLKHPKKGGKYDIKSIDTRTITRR